MVHCLEANTEAVVKPNKISYKEMGRLTLTVCNGRVSGQQLGTQFKSLTRVAGSQPLEPPNRPPSSELVRI